MRLKRLTSAGFLLQLLLLPLFTVGSIMTIHGGTRGWQGPAGLCVLSIVFSLTVVQHRLKRLPTGAVPDFLTVFLAFEVLNKSLTIVSLIVGREYVTSWEARDLVEPVYAFGAELVFLSFLVLFTIGWHVMECRRPQIRKPKYPIKVGGLITFYLTTMLLAIFLTRTSGFSLGALPSFLLFSALAAVGLLLSSDGPYGLRGRRWLFTLALLSPLFYLAMASGTKGGMIVVALPLLVAGLVHGVRRIGVVVGALAVFMVVLGIPLSEQMRAANWESTGGKENIGLREGLHRVVEEYETGRAPALIASTFVRFCNRASSAQMGGLVMLLAEEDGYIGTETIQTLPTMFIPRVLWPAKPSYSPGAWFTWYLGNAQSPDTATSATAMMLGTESYWMGGITSLIFIGVGLGALYSAVWRLLAGIAGASVMGYAAMYALLGEAIRFEEANVLYAVSQPITYLVYAGGLALADLRMRPAIRRLLSP